MFVKCRPFHLPGEISAILLAAVYIPPSPNNKDREEALGELYRAISEQQTAQADSFLIVAGDFNHANLKTFMPNIYQHVDFPTRENNTLDLVYTTIKRSLQGFSPPHIGLSDHLTAKNRPTDPE